MAWLMLHIEHRMLGKCIIDSVQYWGFGLCACLWPTAEAAAEPGHSKMPGFQKEYFITEIKQNSSVNNKEESEPQS